MAIEVLSVSKQARRQHYDRNGRPSLKQRELYAKPRLYLAIDMGEDGYAGSTSPMEHMLFDRYSARELAKFAREGGFITEALRQAGLPTNTRVTFSQKAGCSCGCSPALILNHQTYSPFDLWVDLGDKALVEAAAGYRETTKYLMARKAGRAIIKNAQLAGPGKHSLKKLKNYFSEASYHTPFTT